MRKADLLSVDPPEDAIKGNRTGQTFYVGKILVHEMDIYARRTGVINYLVRHFTWGSGYLTYWTAEEKWTRHTAFTLTGYSPLIWTEASIETEKAKEAETVFRKEYGKWPDTYENEIREKKIIEARARKSQRIDKHLREITPALPKGFRSWMKSKAPDYAFLRDDKTSCGRCHKDIENKKKRGEIKCPHCGRSLKITKCSEKATSTYYKLFQPTKNGKVMERHFSLGKWQQAHTDTENITEELRIVRDGFQGRWKEYYYGERYGVIGREQSFWDKNQTFYNTNHRSFIYTKNLEEVTTPQIKSFFEFLPTIGIENVSVGTPYMIEHHPEIEYIYKSGYRQLIKDYDRDRSSIDFAENTLWGMIGVTKAQYRELKALDANYIAIKCVRSGYSVKDSAEFGKTFSPMVARDILNEAISYNLKLAHLTKLLKGEGEGGAILYRDYLRLAQDLGMNPQDEIVYRNKNWRARHDEYSEELNRRRNKERYMSVNKKFKNITKDKKRNEELFAWETKGYKIIVPKNAMEIVKEGQKQHHCVGASDTYMKKMNSRQTFIVFLRKEDDLKKPFYTIECKADREIVQAYGEYDRRPEWDTVRKLLKQWKKEQPKQKERKKAAV